MKFAGTPFEVASTQTSEPPPVGSPAIGPGGGMIRSFFNRFFRRDMTVKRLNEVISKLPLRDERGRFAPQAKRKGRG